MKVIYSLNCAAYIQMSTGIVPDLEIETSGAGNGLVKCIFPECDAVAFAIDDYHQNKSLHLFLSTYKELREAIKEARGV